MRKSPGGVSAGARGPSYDKLSEHSGTRWTRPRLVRSCAGVGCRAGPGRLHLPAVADAVDSPPVQLADLTHEPVRAAPGALQSGFRVRPELAHTALDVFVERPAVQADAVLPVEVERRRPGQLFPQLGGLVGGRAEA